MLIDDLLAVAAARGVSLALWQESPGVVVAALGLTVQGRGATPNTAMRALRRELDRPRRAAVVDRRRAHGLSVVRGGAG